MYGHSWNFTPLVSSKLDYGGYPIHYVFFDFWSATALLGFTNDKKMGQDLEHYRICGYGGVSGFNWLRNH